MKRKHPIQKIAYDDKGVIRFVENKIVSFLLDEYKPGLNSLHQRFWSDQEDYEQLMMLIGYSVDGFGSLSYSGTVPLTTVSITDRMAERLRKVKESEEA